MARQKAANRWSQFDRLIVVLAALLLLLMPANYRGGASLSHPHALFQFWSSDDLHADHHHLHEYKKEHDRQLSATAPPPDTPVITEMSVTSDPASAFNLELATSVRIGLGHFVLVPASSWSLSTISSPV